MNAQIHDTTERNNEITQRLETNIEKVKDLFEIRIQDVQGNIYETRNQNSAERIVEILGNGQEGICKELTENNYEIRSMQERILTNMKTFNEANTQEIKRMILETRNTEEFNDFTQRLFILQ
jgi:16S rRNA C1402 (ribose-2'-O) methylase RsmI